MHIHPRTIAFLALISLCIVGILTGYLFHAQEIETNELVAIVNGTEVFYKDIKVDPKIIQLTYAQELGARQLKKEIRKHEMRRLAGKIHEVIYRQKIDELGLIVSEEEVDYRVEEIFQQANMTSEKAAVICESARAFREALEAWQKNPSMEDVIYNEKLVGSGVTKEQWKLYQICFDTPEKLKLFAAPNNIEDMKRNSRRSSRKDMFYKKLNDIITKNVSVRNEEIEEIYEKKYAHIAEKPPLDELLKETLRLELLIRKKHEAEKLWWQEQYRQAMIEIKNPRFKDVLNILLK